MEPGELLESRPVRLAVVGTGTEVGKTHLSVALLHALREQGHSAVGLKPVESGISEGETDTSRLASAGTFHVKHSAPYRFPDPVSPHLAARRAGVEIDPAKIVNWVAASSAPWTVVETAGGLLSPLARGVTNLDLLTLLAPDVIVLVGVDRLGVLHDVAACLLALRYQAPTLPRAIVVLQAPERADSSTGSNVDELATLGIAARATGLPRATAWELASTAGMVSLLAEIQAQLTA
jgi:dethiobiotin synthetase